MAATEFICPDGNKCFITECLNKGCRMASELPAGRCLSIRTLRLVADQRPWTGTPSTTQLLKGTREAYLEITTTYAIDPQKALFRVHGSKGHAILDKFTGANELGEERLSDGISSGAFDFYDAETENLFDTKTSGSYKVRKALGLYQIDVPTGEVYKTGDKKGQPKTRKEWQQGGRRDLLDWAIQLNDYRIKLESCGFPVKRMFIEAICRDGGIQAASRNGIEQNGVLIPIIKIPDRHIKAYMTAKRDALINSLRSDGMPIKCRSRESWNGRKCQGYCDVSEHCQAFEKQKEETA